jgi:rubrerythrin
MGVIEGSANLFPIEKLINFPVKVVKYECGSCAKTIRIMMVPGEPEPVFCPACGAPKNEDVSGPKEDILDT